MNTVQDYNARATSGNTVSAQEKAKASQRDSIQMEMNAVIIALNREDILVCLLR